VVTLCVFVSLSLSVYILEIEHSTIHLKRWTKNLKCCERNRRCEKWERLVFLWFEIRVCSIYCKLNGGNGGGNIFLKKRIVRNTSSKFHVEGIYWEFFTDLCWNLLDVIAGFFGVSKGIDRHNTTITSGCKKWDWLKFVCENNVKTSEM